ncbi:ABC transporter substrate-binding protein [Variovorax paradoxus]|nr:ABC transporter substrate-binding protein [Variovorax paradoxus]MBT2301991.1 ABC transporter substrate-binding protein [Variovorax paradoxus]MBT2326709.1 ABC transporter substrate-binding protein [Variovorax paradoxus]
MTVDRRQFVAAGAATALIGTLPFAPQAHAQEKVVKFGMAQDFTVVYTFVTAEYSQGQRDYFSLVNERGGVNGWKIVADIVDTGNAPQRGIEAYERFKRNGVVLIDPLSTPVSRALVTRALQDKINLVTTFSGRSDAGDGTVFPYVLPLSASYWSQAAILIEYMARQDKDLKGKKIAFVHIDTPFGREPLPLLQALAKRRGFELLPYSYAPPGNEQSAVWTQLRRAKPDWTLIWGGGVGQTVSVKEALRNGIAPDRIASVVWLSESDMKVVGPDQAKGVLKYEGAAAGREPKVIQDILREVVHKGKGAGAKELVGTAYYNIGVMAGAVMVEGVRRALEITKGTAVTAEALNEGLRSIKNFTADGLIPPLTTSKIDHQGGGMGRIAQWDGTRWVPKSDWLASDQDAVWELIRASSAEFKKTGT